MKTKTHLNNQEQEELESLLLDIQDKDKLIEGLANKAFDSLIKLSGDDLINDKRFHNRDIILQLV